MNNKTKELNVFTNDRECCDHIYESYCPCCIGECDKCKVNHLNETRELDVFTNDRFCTLCEIYMGDDEWCRGSNYPVHKNCRQMIGGETNE
jgi:hypothetical protein